MENGNITSGNWQLSTGQFNEWMMMLYGMAYPVEKEYHRKCFIDTSIHFNNSCHY